MAMKDSVNVDEQCAKALLDAWRSNDSALMGELAALARLGMKEFYVTDPAESERLELLGAIAIELHRASSIERKHEADPYVRLLLHLVNPSGMHAGASSSAH